MTRSAGGRGNHGPQAGDVPEVLDIEAAPAPDPVGRR